MSRPVRSLLTLLQRCVTIRKSTLLTANTTRTIVRSRSWSWSSVSGPRFLVHPAVEGIHCGLCTKTGAQSEDEYPPLPAYEFVPESQTKEVYIVHVKGLFWSCTIEDIEQFFSDCRIREGVKGIQLITDRLGRSTGQALLELEHEDDVRKALEKHRKYLGPRYVLVSEVTNVEAENILKQDMHDRAGNGVVRLRGIPFSCTNDDIIDFFKDLDIAENGIVIVTNAKGRLSGKAYVQFSSQEAADKALLRNGELIGSRYIEVYPSRQEEVEAILKAMTLPDYSERVFHTSSASQTHHQTVSEVTNADAETILKQDMHDQAEDCVTGAPCEDEYPPLPAREFVPEPQTKEVHIVHVKGLAWSSTVEDIEQFFSDCRIYEGVKGIQLLTDRLGRSTGEALLELEHEDDVRKALEKHRKYLGPRYVLVSEVTNVEAENILKQNMHDQAGDGAVRLRGIPFSCTNDDIIDFFKGLDIAENRIVIVTNARGRRSGEAYVQFSSQEAADKALLRDRELIGSRYIEVYPSRQKDVEAILKTMTLPDYSERVFHTSSASQTHHQTVSEVTNADAETILKQDMHDQAEDCVTGAPCEDEYPPLPAREFVPEPQTKEVHIVHVKGLAWSSTVEDIEQFFSDCRIREGVKGIYLLADRLGRSTGQAFLELEHEDDVRKALEKHRKYLGPRYVLVSEVTIADAENILKQDMHDRAGNGVVRLRGIPFSCTNDDIIDFFKDLDIAENGIVIVTNARGRRSGEAYVQFSSQEAADKALLRDRELIGSRYIEVYPSRQEEVEAILKAMTLPDYSERVFQTSSASQTHHQTVTNAVAENILKQNMHDRAGNGVVRLRGIPFSCTNDDIIDFFKGLDIAENGIVIVTNARGRLSGEAYVQFSSQEAADKALLRDRELIGSRYIEVYPSRQEEVEAILKAMTLPDYSERVFQTSSASQTHHQTVSHQSPGELTHFIHMRGLPFHASGEDIVKFFSPLVISKIIINYRPNGMSKGDADVFFSNHQDVLEAMSRDKMYIGQRYIELFMNSEPRQQ